MCSRNVTGVVLANASMDVAMHDRYIEARAMRSVIISPRWKTSSNNHLDAFTVGLIDGDGSLQVNHWRGRSIQFRLVVKLRNKPYNYEILTIIANRYGGYVRIVRNRSFVQWVVNDQKIFHEKIMPLMRKYPPLTTRMHLQLAFFRRCLSGISISEYMETRGQKYDLRRSITPLFTVCPRYFSSWLSGFIEREGSFRIRSGSVGFSFSISQTNDHYLLRHIRNFFGQSHLTVQFKQGSNPFYFLEMRNIKAMTNVVTHCQNYPLLGHKYFQLATVMENSVTLSNLRHIFWYNK